MFLEMYNPKPVPLIDSEQYYCRISCVLLTAAPLGEVTSLDCAYPFVTPPATKIIDVRAAAKSPETIALFI